MRLFGLVLTASSVLIFVGSLNLNDSAALCGATIATLAAVAGLVQMEVIK